MTTIITLIVLVSVGIVTVDGECQPNNGPIENCCCLGYNNNNYNVNSSGVYTIANFCGVKCSNTRVYVTGFEKSHLPRTQHQDTLFTIKR